MPPNSVLTTLSGGPEYRRATASIGLLAAVAMVYLGGLEVAARVLVPVHSALTARIRADWSAAVRFGGSPLPDRASFLVVGNSLLQAGIDREELSALQRGNAATVAVMPVENTAYLDWYFGARRLLAEGSMPQFLVLCLTPADLVSNLTDGAVFARILMRPADILRVKQAARLDWTTTSTYLMASASAWIGLSTEIRNWIRNETVPGMPELAHYFLQRAAPFPHTDVVEEIVGRRLGQFATLCAAHGCKGMVVIPPSLRDPGVLAALAHAGRAAGVPVLIPVAPGELGQSYFRDGFHLNERGADIFTPRLWEALEGISHAELPDELFLTPAGPTSPRCPRSTPAVQC